jgi:hypothetical protein
LQQILLAPQNYVDVFKQDTSLDIAVARCEANDLNTFL